MVSRGTRNPVASASRSSSASQCASLNRRPDIGEVYMMLCRTKDALDMIPDPDLARAKCAMNTLEDLLWQAVNPR